MGNPDRCGSVSAHAEPIDPPDGEGGGSAQRSAALATGDGSDAPPSNRASERSEEDEFVVVWRGIDSLELSFSGMLGEERASELTTLKALAQDRDPEKQAGALLSLCGQLF